MGDVDEAHNICNLVVKPSTFLAGKLVVCSEVTQVQIECQNANI